MATVTNLNPTKADVGYTVEVTCQGFNPNAELTITIGTVDAVIVGQSAAGPHGSLTAHFIVPQVPSGLRKVTVSDVPVLLSPITIPTLGTFHTVVSDTYLDVSPAPVGLPPPGPGSTGGGGGPIPTNPRGPQPGTGVYDPNPTIVITAGIVESAASLKATEFYDDWRSIVGGAGEFAKMEPAFNTIATSVLVEDTAPVFAEVAVGAAADIEAFPFVAGAAALLLAEWGFGWILTKIAKYFPNPSIFGWHPLGFIVHGIYNLGKQFEQSSADIGKRVGNFLFQPFRQLFHLITSIGNSIVGAHNKVGRVVNHVIPQAMLNTVAAAGAYADATVATLQAEQTTALANVARDVNAVAANAKLDATAGAAAMFDLLQRGIFERLADDQATLTAIQNDLNVELPLEVTTAANAAAASGDQALVAQVATLGSQIAALQTQVVNHEQANASREAKIQAAGAEIKRLVTALPIDQAAVTAQENIITTNRVDIATSITAIESLESQITGISDTLGKARTAQALRTTQKIPTEVVAVAGLATMVATMAKVVYNLKTKVDTCMVDRCNVNSPHGLKTELLALLALLTDAGELAFLAGAIRDPLTVANSLAPTLETVDAGAVSLLNSLLGL